MCLSSPSPPAPPPPPKLPQVAKAPSEAAAIARARTQRQVAASAGQSSTILTSPLGDTSLSFTTGKTLLGS